MAPIKSQSSLAKSIGVSPRTVTEWLGRPDWPFAKRGPWNVKAIQDWRSGLQEDRSRPPTNNQAQANLEYKAEQARTLKMKREILEGNYVPRDQQNRAIIEIINTIRRKLEEWLDSLPPRMEHLPEMAIRVLLTEAYDTLCEEMYAAAGVGMTTDDRIRTTKKNATKARAVNRRHYG